MMTAMAATIRPMVLYESGSESELAGVAGATPALIPWTVLANSR